MKKGMSPRIRSSSPAFIQPEFFTLTILSEIKTNNFS